MRIWNAWFEFRGVIRVLELRFWISGIFRVQGVSARLRVWSLGLRIEGLGLRVKGLEFRV